jgi:hypothetical protein
MFRALLLLPLPLLRLYRTWFVCFHGAWRLACAFACSCLSFFAVPFYATILPAETGLAWMANFRFL